MSTLILEQRYSDCPQCKPYRQTNDVCKDQESKAAVKLKARLLQRIQLRSGTSCKGINSLRCQRQMNLASSTTGDIIVYLVLVLLINIFCPVFLPCIDLYSMQNLDFVIARHALTVTGKLYLKAISSKSICIEYQSAQFLEAHFKLIQQRCHTSSWCTCCLAVQQRDKGV